MYYIVSNVRASRGFRGKNEPPRGVPLTPPPVMGS